MSNLKIMTLQSDGRSCKVEVDKDGKVTKINVSVGTKA